MQQERLCLKIIQVFTKSETHTSVANYENDEVRSTKNV